MKDGFHDCLKSTNGFSFEADVNFMKWWITCGKSSVVIQPLGLAKPSVPGGDPLIMCGL